MLPETSMLNNHFKNTSIFFANVGKMLFGDLKSIYETLNSKEHFEKLENPQAQQFYTGIDLSEKIDYF